MRKRAMSRSRAFIATMFLGCLMAVSGQAAAGRCADAFDEGVAAFEAAATVQAETRRLIGVRAAAAERLDVAGREIERRKIAHAAFEEAGKYCDTASATEGPRPSELQSLIARNKRGLHQAQCLQLGFQARALIDEAETFQTAPLELKDTIRDRFAAGYKTLKKDLMAACPEAGGRIAMQLAKIEHHALSLMPMARGSGPDAVTLQNAFRSAMRHYETRDYRTAARHFRTAAEGGHARAQYYLGRLHLEGLGVRKSDDLALQWFTESATRGDPAGQNSLGLMYDLGRGVAEDDVTAVVWYERAAEQGLPFAQTNLGQMYEQGHGVQRDLDRAVKLYKSAAQRGHMRAHYRLGLVYQRGLGVKKDLVTAITFYQRAADRGYKPAQQALAELGS